MTDNRTAELREKLGERGVKHEDSELTDFHDGTTTYYTEWGGNDDGDGANVYVEYVDGTVLRMFDATPEQAIAATLGNGTLTAEQVREAIERHSAWVIGNNRCFHDGAYEEIADGLNAERHVETCEPDEPDGWYKCPDCGCVVGYWLLNDDSWTIYMDDYQIPFNHCPNCGKAVD